MSIQQNLTELRKNIDTACTLIAVSKTQPAQRIMEAYEAGQRVFGENRAQELAAKHQALPRDIEWHMIGHLQSNKIKYIAPFVALIHSVDSARLLEEINRQAAKAGRTISCLLQVHIAEEETKFGFSEEEILAFIDSPAWATMSNVEVRGLMGMATFTDDTQRVRGEFRTLHTLFTKLRSRQLPQQVSMQELSMGMSGDYKIAMAEGSTMVRVGSAIFAPTPYT